MSVIAEFTIPADAFALHQTFETTSGETVEVERLATHSREWIMPFVWTTDEPTKDVEEAFRTDPSIDEIQQIGSDEHVGQFKVEWTEDIQQLVDKIVDQHGIMQEAVATGGNVVSQTQVRRSGSDHRISDVLPRARPRLRTPATLRRYRPKAP